MRKDHEIFLLSIKSGKSQSNDTIEIAVERKVLAERKSIRQTEFYQAQATDLRPEYCFKVWSAEYNEETKFRYKGKVYNIIRTFEADAKNIELIGQGVVNRGPAEIDNENQT